MRGLRLIDRHWRASYSAHRLDEFVARCHQRGIAVTPQRLAVIEALLASDNHPSTDEIYAAVRRTHPHVSWATVHRILEQFCEVGEAGKVTLLHDAARYDGNVEPHHHVLCVRCRRVHDVQIPAVDNLLQGTATLGQFALLRCSVEIDALCARCQLESRPPPSLESRPQPSPHALPHAALKAPERSAKPILGSKKEHRGISHKLTGG
ncbi:MAG TPA: Fur family transcriptional regulator [Candidatus Binataceae bacterium]|nr:Fur family transcriptional regulator [Candidatus Binataceae bacterium]